MDTPSFSRRSVALVLAVVLIVAAASGAGALTVDTETTDTSATSDLQQDTVLTQPHNGSQVQNISIVGDSSTNTSGLANPESNFSLYFVVNDTGSDQNSETLYETDENWSVTTISGAPDQYNLTVANPRWGDELEYGGGENVTVDARVVFNESQTDESWENITFFVDPPDSQARVKLASDERDVRTDSLAPSSVPVIGGNGSETAQVSDTVPVTQNTSEITVDVENDSTVNAFSKVADETDSGSMATIGYAEVNGQMVPLFSESADASWLNDSAAYATVNSDGTQVTIHNANETFDTGTSEIDVSATGNQAVGLFEMQSMLSDYGASVTTQFGTAAQAINIDGNPFN